MNQIEKKVSLSLCSPYLQVCWPIPKPQLDSHENKSNFYFHNPNFYKRRDAARASFWELKNISPQSPDDDKHRFPIRSQFILTKGALTKGMTSMRGSITSLDVCMDFFVLSLSLFGDCPLMIHDHAPL